MTSSIYRHSLALLTDLYQLTMSYGYWKEGLETRETVFHHFYRRKPFDGGYTIASGLESLIDYLQRFHFDKEDIAYLRGLKGYDKTPLFDEGFLSYLSQMTFTCNIDALPEGSVVFPFEPLIRVQGPLIQCQILESALLDIMNFPSLIATKAARIKHAAGSDEVLEFGLRRAQGIDGALTASRAAYVGGCDATSNVLAGKLFDIPVKGTHAHSWVMVFDSEIDSFRAYARAMPNNCIFLVDTYNTLEGVKNAILVEKEMRKEGKKLLGVRLDSGDLAYLSIEARKLLDEAGLHDVKIIASNELDELIINDMKRQDCKISTWGVGTNLVTAKGQPALDGVYKLSAVRDPGGEWVYRVKLSEQMRKISNPGIMQIRRFSFNGEYRADLIYDLTNPPEEHCRLVDPFDVTRQLDIPDHYEGHDLLVPIFREGKLVYNLPSLKEIRQHREKELSLFHSGIKRFINPHQYVVGMESSFYKKKIDLVTKARVDQKKMKEVQQ